MLGAILGDIIGSPYEFDWNNIKTMDFPLFCERSHFTDDTVLTLAVADGLMNGFGDRQASEAEIINSMRKFGKMYPDSGFGARFLDWLHSSDPKPYDSFGNGSAMRVSAVAWMFDSLEQVEDYALISARVTHDHPEGIKGAQATAAAIFLARNGTDKTGIRRFVEQGFGYDFHRSLDDIRPGYHHVESCQETVPEALTAFWEGTSFEDTLRKAVSLGGDSDTLAAISGSVAEAFFGVPDDLASTALAMLDGPLLEIVERWQRWIKRKHK